MFTQNFLKISRILIKEQQLIRKFQASYHTTNSLFNESKKPEAEKRFKIYTKTGDKGNTSLYTGERLPKNDLVFDALGNADELNSSIGMSREYCTGKHAEIIPDLEGKLIKIQSVILDIGSHIATPKSRAGDRQLERLGTFNPNLIKELENWIDNYDSQLPILKNFILPSGLFTFFFL